MGKPVFYGVWKQD